MKILHDTKAKLTRAAQKAGALSEDEKAKRAEGRADDKIAAALAKLESTLEKSAPVAREECISALADCERALFRAAKRAEDMQDRYERVEISQTHGPKLEFTGVLLCETEYETRGRDRLSVRLEIWQTQGGALIAARYAEPAARDGFETIDTAVVAPQEDAQAMRFAVMDHFRWDMNARTMVGKKLKWTLRQEVA
ncbi:hypothetical protein [Caenibius sp. WL]|uniref:hypothetical protein n=1 Tax=Caenibius sp. WL TaxID=2872646 RepID=UPI001C9A20A2|nr:hypothetical protein [Caenibius sp. WL]QZP06774.1 hypothetical protein K5X80_08540 [Caenibius sp. WL]